MTNKQPIPWARLAAESAAIVFSILLAFSLEAWWTDRQRESEVQATVDNLIAEFDQSAIEFARALGANNYIASAADSFLADLAADYSNPQVDLNDLAFLTFTPTSNPQQGVLDAMISSGSLDLIENADLRMALANWPAELANLQEEEFIAQSFVHHQLRPYLAEDINLSNSFDLHVELLAKLLNASADESTVRPTDILLDKGKTNVANASDVNHLVGLIRARKSLASYSAVATNTVMTELNSIRASLQHLNEEEN